MAKGYFTQGFAVLFDKEISIKDIKPMLSGYKIINESEAFDHWEFSGPFIITDFLNEVNGLVSIDIVNRQWPDHMGDPKNETFLFGAWSLGHFGPYAYPEGLKRSANHSLLWKESGDEVLKHKSFVRLRISYIFGKDKDAKVLPDNYNPLNELLFLTELAEKMLDHKNALCFFNPNGEVILPKKFFDESLSYCRDNGLPFLNLWSNIRLLNINDQWHLMDSAGNAQLDIPDIEMVFPKDKFDLDEIDRFIRNVTLYMLDKGTVIKNRDTMDGPGGKVWQAAYFDNGLSDPPRNVLRWLPAGADNPPEIVL